MTEEQGTTRVLVGVHEGDFTGIDTYAEQVAAAGAWVGHDVTLLTTTEAVAHDVRRRLGDSGVRTLDLGLRPATSLETMRGRVWPGLNLRRLRTGLALTLNDLHETFPVAHLNHPGLAEAVRPFAARICVAAWFYPHSLLGRMVETWRHTGAGWHPRSTAIALKSISHYLNDRRGYRHSDCVVAPTELLARQLRSQGVPASMCPPPTGVLPTSKDPTAASGSTSDGSSIRLLICSGDLSHPRKNVRAALRAVRLLALQDRQIVLELIGRNAAALQSDMDGMPTEVRVSVLGPLPPGEVYSHMRNACALLFPSLFEEWGYVAAESLLCGTPVVTFPVYPFVEMITPGFGVRARDNTVAAFAEAIEQILAQGRPIGLAAAAGERLGYTAVGRRLTRIWLRR